MCLLSWLNVVLSARLRHSYTAALSGAKICQRDDSQTFALGSPDSLPDAAGLPYTSFDHSKAHFYRYDEQVSLCLERLKWECCGFAVFVRHFSNLSANATLNNRCVFSVRLWLGKIRPNLLCRYVRCNQCFRSLRLWRAQRSCTFVCHILGWTPESGVLAWIF